MQATADPAETPTSADRPTTDRQPVRLLVPDERRTTYYVPEQDTLRAADLGLNRNTTDGELMRMIRPCREMLASAGITEDAETYLRRIRDGLRHPRDISEAREWGMKVPRELNLEEFVALENPHNKVKVRKKTGWWWVIDPTRTETREEREQRLLSDDRLVDMKASARILCRTYITVKDLKVEGDRVRRMLRDPAFLRSEAIKRMGKGNGVRAAGSDPGPVRAVRDWDDDQAGVDTTDLADPWRAWCNLADVEATMADELAYARKYVVKAWPPRRDRVGQSDVWCVSDICRSGRDNARLDEWYEKNVIKQTGRPPGSRTKKRRPHAVAAD
jgi:hypothetical protein